MKESLDGYIDMRDGRLALFQYDGTFIRYLD